MTSNRLGSTGVLPMPYEGFYLNFKWPTGTDHTGRTMTLRVRNRKTDKAFTLAGPGTEITVASETISVAVPKATVGTGGNALSDVMSTSDNAAYSFVVLDSGGDLVARIQGDILWAPQDGQFDES